MLRIPNCLLAGLESTGLVIGRVESGRLLVAVRLGLDEVLSEACILKTRLDCSDTGLRAPLKRSLVSATEAWSVEKVLCKLY